MCKYNYRDLNSIPFARSGPIKEMDEGILDKTENGGEVERGGDRGGA